MYSDPIIPEIHLEHIVKILAITDIHVQAIGVNVKNISWCKR